MPEQEEENMDKKQESLEERLEKTRKEIIETFKRRRESEKEFLEVIKKQNEYWKSRLKETDPKKDEKRYDELKEKIKNEKTLMGQIREELVRIDEELKQEREHRDRQKKL